VVKGVELSDVAEQAAVGSVAGVAGDVGELVTEGLGYNRGRGEGAGAEVYRLVWGLV